MAAGVFRRLGIGGRVYPGARETLEFVLARRLHLDWRRPNGAKLQADPKTGGSLHSHTRFARPKTLGGHRVTKVILI